MITLSQIQEAASNEMGWESIPSPVPSALTNFINRICEDIYGRQKWSWRRKSSSLVFSGTTATLPTDLPSDGDYDIREVISNGSDNVYTKIDEASRDRYFPGDYVYWITQDGSSTKTINILETSNPTLSLVYFADHEPLVDGTDTTLIPRIQPIAVGVRAKMIKYLDQDQNNLNDRREYEDEILKMRAEENRTVSKRAISPMEAADTYLGDIGTYV